MARTKNRFDFDGAEENVGSWLNNTGRTAVPVVLGIIAAFFVVTRFV